MAKIVPLPRYATRPITASIINPIIIPSSEFASDSEGFAGNPGAISFGAVSVAAGSVITFTMLNRAPVIPATAPVIIFLELVLIWGMDLVL